MDSAWSTAIANGDVDSVIRLLERGIDVDSRDRYGQTALMLAARAGYDEIVGVLVARGADLNVTAKFGLSALMLAIINERTNIARLLAHAGADLSLRGTGAPGFFDKTASDLARARGMLDLAEELQPK